MKTKEELNAIREEMEALNQKLAELTEEELTQVSGGVSGGEYTTTATFTCTSNRDFDRGYIYCVGEHYIMNEPVLYDDMAQYREQKLDSGLYQISFDIDYLGIYFSGHNCGLYKSGSIVFQRLR